MTADAFFVPEGDRYRATELTRGPCNGPTREPGSAAISAELDHAAYLFINTDLNVSLHRHPVGPWVGLEARTRVESDGIGLATSALWDARGRLGWGQQSLLVASRRDRA
jgi:hypothetical protein